MRAYVHVSASPSVTIVPIQIVDILVRQCYENKSHNGNIKAHLPNSTTNAPVFIELLPRVYVSACIHTYI